jgi:hypothetical protein
MSTQTYSKCYTHSLDVPKGPHGSLLKKAGVQSNLQGFGRTDLWPVDLSLPRGASLLAPTSAFWGVSQWFEAQTRVS